ncbi:MAG: 2OG-Fe dioxygenase family protein [Elusimicrobia bacterium]|nr:2OG-Fe dioxygenase family protein [Elusimicrobiota bacterium]
MMSKAQLERRIRRDGFAFVSAPDMHRWLMRGRPDALADWTRFVGSWQDLRRDEYMADGGRDRLRRHAVLKAEAGSAAIRLEPRQPHYQSRDYNALNGGVARWFEPIAPEIVAGSTMTRVLAFGCGLFGRLRPGAAWKIELHQFRIEATAGGMGRPTPEGVHRDGVDCALVMLVRRENVASGTTTVHDLAGKLRGSFTLTEPLDAAIVDDARVMHGVTPITPLDPSRPAYRDVMVATYLKI